MPGRSWSLTAAARTREPRSLHLERAARDPRAEGHTPPEPAPQEGAGRGRGPHGGTYGDGLRAQLLLGMVVSGAGASGAGPTRCSDDVTLPLLKSSARCRRDPRVPARQLSLPDLVLYLSFKWISLFPPLKIRVPTN